MTRKLLSLLIKKINEAKKQKEYAEFQLKIQKYEKQITDGSSSLDTNSNSKEVKNNNNY